MLPEYLCPGVFVEEIQSGPGPIKGANTNAAWFLRIPEWAIQIKSFLGE